VRRFIDSLSQVVGCGGLSEGDELGISKSVS
jgi:hypothetical protein